MPIRELVIATGNRKKLAELQSLVAVTGIQLHTQTALGIEAVEETGQSFVENAILKARHASLLSAMPALADDSGLEVDALNGEPGIYSARYAGEPGADAANNRKLLEALRAVPEHARSARFHCVLALLRHARDPVPLIFSASWEGRILLEARGSNGFGYDPLFWIPDQGCSAAELSVEQKNRLSHRARALAQLLPALGGMC